MPSDDSNAKALPAGVLDIYKDIRNNIRASDDFSFKLLGIVPVVSGVGSGGLAILEKSALLEAYSGPAVVALSTLGALIVFGLFRCELRNIQKCDWLISRAANLETQILEAQILHKDSLQFAGMAKDEHLSAKHMSEVLISSLFEPSWGKTQSEKVVYAAAIAVWLVPLGIATHRLFNPAC